ncbi:MULTISPECIES: short-chain fatty acyl-CoA regulator family protein [unclassified Sphingomonas]|uniref:helix-turn-helix domain-containing protein n=1 Tax=unclassified Sphingomonas TaxID=196159 RepID=UPI002150BCEF|nr:MULTISPECIES: helix-turn-helix transcriptional regulator [unclassified Sphingomonas]MCR5872541.1 short-chain fatty acyl-CoA regulator family protein [Sphingomonas sp. J344]UUX99175.1 short-chain fatty acyl-CoA regulator family protein [Sphingomonas sp. J315]
MAERKLFAGHAVRRLRRGQGLTQAAMAEMLGVSASYLNLVERNQRPLSATLMLSLAQVFDFDPRTLAAGEPGGGEEAMRRRLADPLFADIEVDRTELTEWLAGAPGGAEAFARAYDRIGAGGTVASGEIEDPGAAVRREVERWRNHFADLDAAAETLADELRIASSDPFGAMAERLRVKHQLAIRVLPIEVLSGLRVRLDLHARQLQLSEALDPPSRVFALARQLASEARTEIEALVRGAGFPDRVAERLYRRHLAGYFAAAVMMPYARFLRACEATGYDLELLRRRFGASAEQVAHRLTTLQRVGARGLPFFMLRIDRAGQVSKRFAGASASPLVESAVPCPLLDAYAAFARPDERIVQLVELEDRSRWFTSSRCVAPPGGWAGAVRARFVVTLGLAAEAATGLAAARGLDFGGEAAPVGLGCRACTRECPQRSAAPAGRAMLVSEREAGVSPFGFAAD